MKKTIIIAMMAVCSINMQAQFSGKGSGTEKDPYQITNADQLFDVRNDLTAYYKVMNDIDMGQWLQEDSPRMGWNPIGNATTPFTGFFDGNYKIIKGLFINRPTIDCIGLFGAISAATVKNVCLLNPVITGQNEVGGIVGKMFLSRTYTSSTIQDNAIVGGSITGNDNIGGIVGDALFYSTIREDLRYDNYIRGNGCFANVAGSNNVGGICGVADGALWYDTWQHFDVRVSVNIFDNRFDGHISGTSNVGGVIGQISQTKYVREYSSGSMPLYTYTNVARNVVSGSQEGSNNVAGIVGNCIKPQQAGERKASVINNVCAFDTIMSTNGVAYRISNYEWPNNYSYSELVVLVGGKERSVDDDDFNGVAYGLKTLRRSSFYQGLGSDYTQQWSISEGESLPYNIHQNTPGKITSFTSGSKATISGTAPVSNGTAYIIINGSLFETPIVEGAWSSVVGNKKAGTKALVAIGSGNLMPSSFVSAVAEAENIEPSISFGDANGDGVIDSADVTAIINYILGKPSASFNKENADVTGDGEILIDDAVQTVQLIMNAQ